MIKLNEIKFLPPLFIERLKTIIPEEMWDSVLQTFSSPRPVTFRVNTLKADTETVKRALQDQGFALENIPWYPDAFVITEGNTTFLQETEAFQKDLLYIQSASSMLAPLILNPLKNDKVLDIAAAPGSKTTQMGCLMNGTGEIIANDNSRKRFFKLKANIERQGIPNATLSCKNGQFFGKKFVHFFDKVLVDAPCSSEGRFHISDSESWKYWKKTKSKEMVCRQKPLLYSGINALRPGGRLVYSTCTFAPEENEAVIDWALKKFAGNIALEEIQITVPNSMPGLALWNGKEFNPEVKKTLRILPNAEMEAFFICSIRKT